MAPISTSLIPLEPHFTTANDQVNYQKKTNNKVGGDEPGKGGVLAHMVLLAEMNKIILEKYRQYQHTMQLLLNGLYGISYHLIRKIPFNGSDQARIAVMDEIHLFANMCLTASEKEARMRGKGKLTQLAMEELNLPEIDYLNKTVEILIEKILVEMNFFKEHVESIGQSTAIEVERTPLGSFLHP